MGQDTFLLKPTFHVRGKRHLAEIQAACSPLGLIHYEEKAALEAANTMSLIDGVESVFVVRAVDVVRYVKGQVRET